MAGYEVVKCVDEINQFLGDFPYERNYGGAIFIHKTILSKFSEKIGMTGWNITDANTWPYNLRIGNVIYEMYLVWANLNAMIKSKMHLIVSESKFSFPWESNTTIYTTVEYFYLIEEFIKRYKLKRFVCNKSIDTTRLCIPHDIMVVEFTGDIAHDRIAQFRTFLELNDYKMPHSYFATRAFKFLRPSFLKHYNPCYEYDPNTITQLMMLLDYHRAQSKIGVEIFNLFDLITMKMAIDDNRFEYTNCEFNKLIFQKLNEMSAHRVYIKSKRLNLVDYHIDLGISCYSEEMYQYLLVHYPGYFDRVVVRESGTFKVPLPQIKSVSDLLMRHFKNVEIDVTDLKGRKSNVLLDILSHQHLGYQPIIAFNTSNELEFDAVNTGFVKTLVPHPRRILKFVGTNTVCFIENFFNWLKQTIGPQCPNYELKFSGTNIKHPFILRDMTVRLIVLKKMRITCKLLKALHEVKFELIKMGKCVIENNPDVFVLLESLSGDRYVQINSDENTFGDLTDSIKIILNKSGRDSFQFESYITIHYLEYEYEFVDLTQYKFCFDEDRKKIITYDLFTNEVVDIFGYFCRPRLEDLGTDERER